MSAGRWGLLEDSSRHRAFFAQRLCDIIDRDQNKVIHICIDSWARVPRCCLLPFERHRQIHRIMAVVSLRQAESVNVEPDAWANSNNCYGGKWKVLEITILLRQGDKALCNTVCTLTNKPIILYGQVNSTDSPASLLSLIAHCGFVSSNTSKLSVSRKVTLPKSWKL